MTEPTMEYIHYQILELIVKRRSALTIAQLEHGVIGFKALFIQGALNDLMKMGMLQTMTEKGKTFYQLTLAGLNALEKRAQS